MRLISTAMLACMLPIIVMAQQSAAFTVATTGNFNLKLTLNGRNYSLSDKSVTFQNIQPGSYPINIFQAQPKADGTYDYVKVYDGNANLKAGFHLEIMVLRFGKMVWDEGPLNTDSWTNGWTSPAAGAAGTVISSNNSPVMPDDAFQSLLNILRKAGSDYDRRAMAPGLFKNNTFSAKQITSICGLFADDYYRIDVAKQAYPHCFDKGSYFMVAEAFTNGYYKNALLNFVAAQ